MNKNLIAGALLAGAIAWTAHQNGLLKAGAFNLPQIPGQTQVSRSNPKVPCPKKNPQPRRAQLADYYEEEPVYYDEY